MSLGKCTMLNTSLNGVQNSLSVYFHLKEVENACNHMAIIVYSLSSQMCLNSSKGAPTHLSVNHSGKTRA